MRAKRRRWQEFFELASLMLVHAAEAMLLGLQWRHRPTI
jgi:hypothetical protein